MTIVGKRKEEFDLQKCKDGDYWRERSETNDQK